LLVEVVAVPAIAQTIEMAAVAVLVGI